MKTFVIYWKSHDLTNGLFYYFLVHRINQQGQHLSKTSYSPEGKAMEDFRGLKNSPLSDSQEDLRKVEWKMKEEIAEN